MPEISESKYLVNCGWDDVPHLSERQKRQMWEDTPPHQRKARKFGIPTGGKGRVYTIEWDDVKCVPFRIPDSWPRMYCLDPGIRCTACVWGAIDVPGDTSYLYSEYYVTHQRAYVHASAIRARGEWIPGLIDPAAKSRDMKDGIKLIDYYTSLGLRVRPANNNVEAGIDIVRDRLLTGRMKVFETLVNWQREFEFYHRDEHGKIPAEQMDHLMDATRYFTIDGGRSAETRRGWSGGWSVGSGGSYGVADGRAGY